jgi:flagellar biosynthetic protein FliR
MTISANPELLVGFLLALVRASCWLILVPPFGTRSIPAPVKIGLAAALALPVATRVSETVPSLATPAPLIGAVALQVAVGLSLGFIVFLLFSAVQAAGELIDLFGGFTVAPAYDPLANAQSSTFGRFYHLIAVTLLFAINGHLLLVRGFVTSFDSISATPTLDDFSAHFVNTFGMFFLAALEIAAPLLAALFLAEVAMGLLSKAAPQMNIFMVGMPAKILLTLALAGLALPLLPSAVSSILDNALRAGNNLTDAFGG